MKNKIHIVTIWALLGFMSCVPIGCTPLKAQPSTEIHSDKITFFSRWTPSGKVRLLNGEYREAAAPGSASDIVVSLSDHIVMGQINGKETAAVILTTAAGGSGTFYDLALLIKGRREWVNMDVAHLGDRVKIHSLTIENEMIVVDLTTQGPGDPMCCPNRREVQRFVTDSNRLTQVTHIMDEKVDHVLVGTLWKWQQTLYNNDTKAAPPDATRYTLKLLPGGRLSIRADCNSGGGKYLLKGSEIFLEITHSTLAACPPGSLETIYIQNLNAAAIYFIEGDQLYIDLKYDSGTMRFAR